MSTDVQKALAKTFSLKISLFNAIAELGVRSEEALDAGENVLSSQLALKANELAKQAIIVQRAEDRIRASQGLSAAIKKLDKISADARKEVAEMKKTADAIDNVTKLISIMAKVTAILM